MGRHVSRSYQCHPTDPSDARRFTSDWLVEYGQLPKDAEVVEDAELVVSELVTNAINNHCAMYELALYVADDRLEVSVLDDGAGWPTPQNPSGAAEHGRGLRIVAALSESWGVEQVSDGCKRVWARLATV